jgi:ABC-2 type transport system ATP-binding protein
VNTAPPMIATHGLTKVYRDGRDAVRAVDNLSMTVPAGAVFGFLGPNGSGKSTTIRMLVGLARPSSGEAHVAGADIRRDMDGVHTHIGYLAQSPLFYNYMTGRETLRYIAGFYPWVSDPVEARITELLTLVGLTPAADRKVGGYSGGMKQRLGIAQALVGRPQVVILDEPVSSLDPLGRHEVLEVLDRLRGGATILFSTHILDDVQRVADYVAVLDHGKLITQAPTADLLGRFTRDELDVIIEAPPAAAAALAAALGAVPGVRAVAPGEPAGGVDPATAIRFTVTLAAPEATAQARFAIQALASERGYLIRRSEPLRLDLESVFLRLVG